MPTLPSHAVCPQVFRVSLDVHCWISQLNISLSSADIRRPVLRFVIQNNVPMNDELFSKFFPKFKESYEDVIEVCEPLNGEELLKLLRSALRKSTTLVPVIRMLAVKYHSKMDLADLIDIFRRKGGAAGE